MPQTAATIWASGPIVQVVPLLFQPGNSDHSTWQSQQGFANNCQVNPDNNQLPGGTTFKFSCLFPLGAGHLPVWGFGVLFQGSCIGIVQLDQPTFLQRLFYLNVVGQAQSVFQ
jgi:hypothetical protein